MRKFMVGLTTMGMLMAVGGDAEAGRRLCNSAQGTPSAVQAAMEQLTDAQHQYQKVKKEVMQGLTGDGGKFEEIFDAERDALSYEQATANDRGSLSPAEQITSINAMTDRWRKLITSLQGIISLEGETTLEPEAEEE
jgi:hypothetical protein